MLVDALKILRDGPDGPMRPYFARAAARYLGFVRTRFVRASRGDGTWPGLALSTKIARLRRQYGGRILSTRLTTAERAKLTKSQRARVGRFASVLKATGKATRAGQLAELARTTRFAILRDTNTLFGSLTEGQAGNEVNYSRDGVTISSNVRYGGFHQDPPIPGRPPRREIIVQPDDATEGQMAEELATGIVAAFEGGTVSSAAGGAANG